MERQKWKCCWVQGECIWTKKQIWANQPGLAHIRWRMRQHTLQAKDGQAGGQVYLCTVNWRPQQRSATKDTHFTVLRFTAADGSPVMCTIISLLNHSKKNGRWDSTRSPTGLEGKMTYGWIAVTGNSILMAQPVRLKEKKCHVIAVVQKVEV